MMQLLVGILFKSSCCPESVTIFIWLCKGNIFSLLCEINQGVDCQCHSSVSFALPVINALAVSHPFSELSIGKDWPTMAVPWEVQIQSQKILLLIINNNRTAVQKLQKEIFAHFLFTFSGQLVSSLRVPFKTSFSLEVTDSPSHFGSVFFLWYY